MRNFNWEEFKKGGVAVNCPTKEAAESFLRECDGNSLKWGYVRMDTDWSLFSSHLKNTCYSYRDGYVLYQNIESYIAENFKIVIWSNYKTESCEVKEKKVYKIQDLLAKEMVGRKFKTKNCPATDYKIFEVTTNDSENIFGVINFYSRDFIDREHLLSEILYFEFEEIIENSKQEPKLKGYLANGLFGLGDRLVNELLAKQIRESVDVDLYVPQENLAINNKQAYADSKQIYEGDYNYLKESDFLVAVIDGCEIDSGTAAEIGVVSTMGKKIYALYTDTRQQGTENQRKIEALVNDPTENQFMYRNLFVVGLIKKHGYIFDNIEDLVKQLKEDINNKKLERVK